MEDSKTREISIPDMLNRIRILEAEVQRLREDIYRLQLNSAARP